jgi:hypothetical protein
MIGCEKSRWGLDKAAVLEALKGGKALGAASLVLRFNH